MEAGALKTTRENSTIIERYPFEQLSSGELWYKLESIADGKFVMRNPLGGALMVLHYRCTECGYLESYARGSYP
jgi:hypothetical protein